MRALGHLNRREIGVLGGRSGDHSRMEGTTTLAGSWLALIGGRRRRHVVVAGAVFIVQLVDDGIALSVPPLFVGGGGANSCGDRVAADSCGGGDVEAATRGGALLLLLLDGGRTEATCFAIATVESVLELVVDETTTIHGRTDGHILD